MPAERSETARGRGVGRLRERRDFQAATARGRRTATPGFVLQVRARPEDPEGYPRYGLTASRKVGGAVLRNRARRRLRALAEALLPSLGRPGHDYVLIARRATPEQPYAAMRQDLERALGRLAGVASRGENADNATADKRRRRHDTGTGRDPIPVSRSR